MVKTLTDEQLAKKRANFVITHDKITEQILSGKNGKKIFKGLANAARKACNMKEFNKVIEMVVQKVAEPIAFDGKRMASDADGKGVEVPEVQATAVTKNLLTEIITQIGLEVQRRPQQAFAERIVLSFAEQTKIGFMSGEEYGESPNVNEIAISGFKLSDIISEDSKEFFYQVTFATEQNGVLKRLLEDKYNIFIIELPKLPRNIDKVSENQRELWEICKVLKTRYKDLERMTKMTTLTSPTAKLMVSEFKKTMETQQTLRAIVNWDDEIARIKRQQEREQAEKFAEGVKKATEKYVPQIKTLEQELQKEQQARQKEQQASSKLIAQMQQQMLDAGLMPITMQSKETAPQITTFVPNKKTNTDPKKVKNKNRNAER